MTNRKCVQTALRPVVLTRAVLPFVSAVMSSGQIRSKHRLTNVSHVSLFLGSAPSDPIRGRELLFGSSLQLQEPPTDVCCSHVFQVSARLSPEHPGRADSERRQAARTDSKRPLSLTRSNLLDAIHRDGAQIYI